MRCKLVELNKARNIHVITYLIGYNNLNWSVYGYFKLVLNYKRQQREWETCNIPTHCSK